MRFAYVFVLSRYWLHIGFSYELYLTIFLVVEAFRYVSVAAADSCETS